MLSAQVAWLRAVFQLCVSPKILLDAFSVFATHVGPAVCDSVLLVRLKHSKGPLGTFKWFTQ